MVFGFGHNGTVCAFVSTDAPVLGRAITETRCFCADHANDQNYDQVYNQPHEGSMTHEALGGHLYGAVASYQVKLSSRV